jgi:DNA-binding protein H-NS
MKTANLKNLSVDALLEFRSKVDDALSAAKETLQAQLSRLGIAKAPERRRRISLKGRKVAPKYRGPRGETWAGRGARPRWLTVLVKQGHRIEEFSIDGATRAKARTKGRRKRKIQKRARQ